MRRQSRVALFVLAGVLLSSHAFAQARVRVTRDQASVWRAGFTMLITVLPIGTELDVVGRQGAWYEIVLPESGSVPQGTGFIAVTAVQVISGEPPQAPRTRTTPTTSGASRAQGSTGSAGGSWVGRTRIGINVSERASSLNFTGQATTPAYLEVATFLTAYKVSPGLAFDIGGTVRVAGDFAVGVAVSSSSKQQDGAVTGTVPHPFFFNTPRSITGNATGLEHRELVTHIQAAYLVTVNKTLDVTVIGGPSIFNVSQDLVSGVAFTDVYPYDTATFASASFTKASKTGVGFNVGADVTVRLAQNVGVGALVRFSRASLTFPSPSGDLTLDAGGVQVGGGLRLLF